MFGIIVSEKEEISKNFFEKYNLHFVEFNKIKFYIQKGNKKDFVLCISGVGKVNAAIACNTLINMFGVSKILNVGFCGSSRPNVNLGDVIIVTGAQYCDVDLTHFNYQLNCLPEQNNVLIPIKNDLINFLDKIIDTKNKHKGFIATSDSVICQDNYERFTSLTDNKILGFDMELMSLCQTCKKNNVNVFSLKFVSDNFTITSSSLENYKSYKRMLQQLPNVISYYLSIILDNIATNL